MSSTNKSKFKITTSQSFKSRTPSNNFYRVENDDGTEDFYFGKLKLNNEDYTSNFYDIGERLDDNEQNILASILALTVLQQAQVDGTSDNIVVETFDSQSGYVIQSGSYDSINHILFA